MSCSASTILEWYLLFVRPWKRGLSSAHYAGLFCRLLTARRAEDRVFFAYSAKTEPIIDGKAHQTLSAKDAEYYFGRLIDLAHAEPVAVVKHGRRVPARNEFRFERMYVDIAEFETCKDVAVAAFDAGSIRRHISPIAQLA